MTMERFPMTCMGLERMPSFDDLKSQGLHMTPAPSQQVHFPMAQE